MLPTLPQKRQILSGNLLLKNVGHYVEKCSYGTFYAMIVENYRNSYFANSWHRGLVSTGSRGAAVPPDFRNPKKLSHKNAIKLEFSEKWGKIGLLAPMRLWHQQCGNSRIFCHSNFT